MKKLMLLAELWDYLKVRKKIWLLPSMLLLILLSGLILLTESSVIAPFIYALF